MRAESQIARQIMTKAEAKLFDPVQCLPLYFVDFDLRVPLCYPHANYGRFAAGPANIRTAKKIVPDHEQPCTSPYFVDNIWTLNCITFSISFMSRI